MNICYVYADPNRPGSAVEWRGFRYAAAIQRTNRHTVSLLNFDSFSHNTADSQEVCAAADLIVVEGRILPSCMSVIPRWKARDKIVVVDVGTFAELLQPVGSPATPHEAQGKSSQPPFDWALRLVDAALVPSRQMLDSFTHYTNTYWVPDYIDLDHYLTVNPAPHEGIVLGMQLDPEMLPGLTQCGLLDGLKQVCQARPELRLLAWSAARRAALPAVLEQFSWILPFAIDQGSWPHPLAYVDIALAPLTHASDEWQGWSDLLEFMVMKIPWLASVGPAYHDLRPYGWLVQNNPGSWERVLFDLVDHLPAYKNEAAGEPYLFGISQGIDENVENLLSVYLKIYHNALHPEVSSYAAG